MLESWNDGPAKSSIVDFVGRVTGDGADYVAPQERIAVFDNDGTLWCEKPIYVQLDFLIRRFAEQAGADRALAERQPYRAAAAGDLHWFDDAVTKHYQGDDADIKALAGAALSAHEAMTIGEHASRVKEFFAEALHPTLGRPYLKCGYLPMVELLRYLEMNGFITYIVSGGGREFMRPIAGLMYGIPPERVIGSSVGMIYRDQELFTTARPEFVDDGPMKPVRIWGRIGRRPIFAAGNSDGDLQMLEFSAARTSLQLLVRHDDPEREFGYAAGAERALNHAAKSGWTVVSIRDDWSTVFRG